MNSSSSFSNLSSISSSPTSHQDEVNTKQTNDSIAQKLALLMRGFNETTEENISLTNEKKKLLEDKLDLSVYELPCLSSRFLQKLEKLRALEIPNFTDEISLRSYLIQKKLENKKKERDERKWNNVTEKLFKKYNVLDAKMQTLFDAVSDCEEAIQEEQRDIDNEATHHMVLKNNLSEYENKLEQLRTDLLDLDVQMPGELLKKWGELTDKQGELMLLDKELEYYYNLSPDLLKAKVQLEEKHKEYDANAKKFQDEMSC